MFWMRVLHVAGCMCVCACVQSDFDECVLTDGVTPLKPASTSSSALLSCLHIEVKPPFKSVPHCNGTAQRMNKQLVTWNSSTSLFFTHLMNECLKKALIFFFKKTSILCHYSCVSSSRCHDPGNLTSKPPTLIIPLMQLMKNEGSKCITP